MRTTVSLDDDVVAAVERLRRSEGIGTSEALNRLVRSALAQRDQPRPYVHESVDMGVKIDVSNIGAVLDLLDES